MEEQYKAWRVRQHANVPSRELLIPVTSERHSAGGLISSVRCAHFVLNATTLQPSQGHRDLPPLHSSPIPASYAPSTTSAAGTAALARSAFNSVRTRLRAVHSSLLKRFQS